MEERNQAISETAKQILEEANEAAAKSRKKARITTVPSMLRPSPTRRRQRSATEIESNSIEDWTKRTQDIWDSLQDIRNKLRETNPNLEAIQEDMANMIT